METVGSGIRPTGNLHLGNYFGALRNFLTMQNEHNCYFFIADYHSPNIANVFAFVILIKVLTSKGIF